MTVRASVGALVLLCLPLAAAAQRITITPTIGVFAPLRDQSRWSWTDCCIAGGDFTETLRTELSSATTIGLKVDVEWLGWLGVEASFATANTQRRYIWAASAVPNPPPPDEFAGVAHSTITSLRVKLRKRTGSNTDVRLGIGPSLVAHAREAWCGGEPPCIQDLTTIGAALDITLGYGVTRRARVEIGFVNNLYTMRYPQPPFPGRAGYPEQSRFWQHDIMISAGFGFVL